MTEPDSVPQSPKSTYDGGTRELSRFAAIFAGGTMISRVLGMARDMVFAHVVPVPALGAFLFAFSLPNMLRDMLGEGAVNAALAPVFAEADERHDKREYQRAVASVMSLMLLIFGALTALGVLAMPLAPRMLAALEPVTGQPLPQSEAALMETTRMLQWTFPYLFFIGAAVFATAPLFVARRYGTPSWSPVLLNVAFILCAYTLRNRFENPAWALVVGVWLGGALQMAVLWWDMYRHVGVAWPSFRLRHAAVGQTVLLLLPVIVGQAAGEVNKLVDRFFAMSLGEDKVLALYYSNRLVQLPLSIFGIAVAVALLPALTRAHTHRDTDKARDLLMYGLRQSFFLTAPAAAALVALREPIIRFLFERGAFTPEATRLSAGALLYAAPGLVAFSWVKVTAQGFFSMKDTRAPVIVATCSMLLNILLNLALVRSMGYQGLVFSTTLSFTVNFVALYALLNRRMGQLWNTRFLGAIAGMGAAALLLGLAMGLGHHWTAAAIGNAGLINQFIALAVAGIAGGLSYGGVCLVLRLPELESFRKRLQRRNSLS